MVKNRRYIRIKSERTPLENEEAEAQSAQTSARRLEELAYQSKPLAMLVAQNPKTPSKLLEQLSTPGALMVQMNPPGLPSPWVRPECFQWEVDEDVLRLVAQNPNTPPQALLSLAGHFPKEASQNPALSLAFLESPQLMSSLDEGVWLGLLFSSEFSHLEDSFFSHASESARAFMAWHPETRTQLLERLSQDPSELVRSHLKGNPTWRKLHT